MKYKIKDIPFSLNLLLTISLVGESFILNAQNVPIPRVLCINGEYCLYYYNNYYYYHKLNFIKYLKIS